MGGFNPHRSSITGHARDQHRRRSPPQPLVPTTSSGCRAPGHDHRPVGHRLDGSAPVRVAGQRPRGITRWRSTHAAARGLRRGNGHHDRRGIGKRVGMVVGAAAGDSKCCVRQVVVVVEPGPAARGPRGEAGWCHAGVGVAHAVTGCSSYPGVGARCVRNDRHPDADRLAHPHPGSTRATRASATRTAGAQVGADDRRRSGRPAVQERDRESPPPRRGLSPTRSSTEGFLGKGLSWP